MSVRAPSVRPRAVSGMIITERRPRERTSRRWSGSCGRLHDLLVRELERNSRLAGPDDLQQRVVVRGGWIAALDLADELNLGRILMGDLEPLKLAILGQEVELAPVREDRDHQPADMGQRRLVIQCRAQEPTGLGQELLPQLGALPIVDIG